MTQRPVLPPEWVGVLGGGQLGRYFVMAATTMGYRTVVLDPDPLAPAGVIADQHLVAAFDDPSALTRLGERCAVVTTEFENPPAAALDRLADRTLVAPSPGVVRIAQDRIAEKAFLASNGFAIGPYAVVERAVPERDLPRGAVIVKTARLGYDGKGQRAAASPADALAAWAELGGVPCVVEQRLDLDTELSVIVARTLAGAVETWVVSENRHVDGVLDLSVVPAAVERVVADRAVGTAVAIADALDYVGVLGVELFVVEGDVLVNELAPRPHNSGHWTLDASATSQFEQQVRAVCGLGLGSTLMTAPAAAMVNLLGDLWADGEPDWSGALDDPSATLHLYGKREPRPGRKMGHLTVTAPSAPTAAAKAAALRTNLTMRIPGPTKFVVR
jgi:5-(carboxyamino)imidazole ribonucleotide synthase